MEQNSLSNMTFTFSTHSNLPLYRQLYDYIKNEIRSGQFTAGQKLPSKRKLAIHLGISLNTVETAYEQLSAEGYIRSVPQSGSYVCKLENFMHLPSIPERSNHSMPIPKQDLTTQYQYDLSTNQVDTSYFPYKTWSRIIREIMQEKKQDLLRLTPPQGDYQLRKSLASYLHAFRGVNCSPDQVIVGAGIEYLISLVIQLLGRDRVFAVENPGYQKTSQVLRSNGVVVKPVNLDRDGINICRLEESQADHVYVTPSHQFPLGIIMPISRRMQLLNWAAKDGRRYILEDDYDSEFRFVGRPIPALQGLDRHEQVIYLGTFSKSLAPSIRISYMVLPPKLAAIYQKNFSFNSSTVSRFEQEVLHRFIQDGHFEKHLNRMRIVYRDRKDALEKVIALSPHRQQMRIIGENAGLHLLLQINNGMPEEELIRRAQDRKINLSGLSAYAIRNDRNENGTGHQSASTILIGYSNHEPQEIAKIMSILLDAWFEEDHQS